jgi:hypothetical protein
VAFYNGLTLVACRFAPVAFYAHLFFFLLFKAKAALLIVERPHRAVSCAAFFSFIFLSFSGDDL